jgi:MFS family permease
VSSGFTGARTIQCRLWLQSVGVDGLVLPIIGKRVSDYRYYRYSTTGPQRGHNPTVHGAIAGIYIIGAPFSSLCCTRIGDILGRRRTILASACVCTLGQTLECSAYSLARYTTGRVVLGCGVGILRATVPVWVSECSSVEKRGRNVVLVRMFIAFGFLRLLSGSTSDFITLKMSPSRGEVHADIFLSSSSFSLVVSSSS